jgi:hypothetical protein
MRHSRRFLGALAAAVLATSLTGADAVAKASRSTYCVAIDVDAESAEGLAQRFAAFAAEAGLAIDASPPLMQIYFPPGSQVRYPTDSTRIVALTQMGPFGGVLSFMPLRGDPSPYLLGRLQRFVNEEIAETYRTTLCEHIEGFTPAVTCH